MSIEKALRPKPEAGHLVHELVPVALFLGAVYAAYSLWRRFQNRGSRNSH